VKKLIISLSITLTVFCALYFLIEEDVVQIRRTRIRNLIGINIENEYADITHTMELGFRRFVRITNKKLDYVVGKMDKSDLEKLRKGKTGIQILDEYIDSDPNCSRIRVVNKNLEILYSTSDRDRRGTKLSAEIYSEVVQGPRQDASNIVIDTLLEKLIFYKPLDSVFPEEYWILFYFIQSVLDPVFKEIEAIQYHGFLISTDKLILVNFPEIDASDEENLADLGTLISESEKGAVRVSLKGLDKLIYYRRAGEELKDWTLGLSVDAERLKISKIGTIILMIQALVIFSILIFVFISVRQKRGPAPAKAGKLEPREVPEIAEQEAEKVASLLPEAEEVEEVELEPSELETEPDQEVPELDTGVLTLKDVEEVTEVEEIGEAEVAEEVEEPIEVEEAEGVSVHPDELEETERVEEELAELEEAEKTQEIAHALQQKQSGEAEEGGEPEYGEGRIEDTDTFDALEAIDVSSYGSAGEAELEGAGDVEEVEVAEPEIGEEIGEMEEEVHAPEAGEEEAYAFKPAEERELVSETGEGAEHRDAESGSEVYAAEDIEDDLREIADAVDVGSLPELEKLVSAGFTESEEKFAEENAETEEPPPVIPDEVYREKVGEQRDDELSQLINTIEKSDIAEEGTLNLEKLFSRVLNSLAISRGAILERKGVEYAPSVVHGLHDRTVDTLRFNGDEFIFRNILNKGKMLFIKKDVFATEMLRSKFTMSDVENIQQLFLAPLVVAGSLLAVVVLCVSEGEKLEESSAIKRIKSIKEKLTVNWLDSQ
jgi:hypothetical protein